MSFDSVNRPAHYAEGREYEPIAVIEDWDLCYHLGNAVKYISRAGRKTDALEDLRKAVWYIERHINIMEKRYTTCEEEDRYYREILKSDPRDLGEVQDVDDQKLTHWDCDEPWMLETVGNDCDSPDCLVAKDRCWEYSDEPWMTKGQLSDCGWDPNSGPTC